MNTGKKHTALANFLLLLFCFLFFAILLISSIVGGGLAIAAYTPLPFWLGVTIIVGIYLILGIIIIALAGYTAVDYK